MNPPLKGETLATLVLAAILAVAEIHGHPHPVLWFLVEFNLCGSALLEAFEIARAAVTGR